MSNVTKNHLVDLVQHSSHLNNEVEKTTKADINNIEATSEKFSQKSSEYLAGILGGCIGLLGGFGTTIAGASIVFAGPIGIIFGVAASILIWRGKNHLKIEKANKNDLAIKLKLLAEIKALPKDAPPNVRDKIWKLYNNATDSYGTAVLDALRNFAIEENKLSSADIDIVAKALQSIKKI